MSYNVSYTGMDPVAARMKAILDIADYLDGIKDGNFKKVYDTMTAGAGEPGRELPRKVIIMGLSMLGISGFPASAYADEIILIRGEFSIEEIKKNENNEISRNLRADARGRLVGAGQDLGLGDDGGQFPAPERP